MSVHDPLPEERPVVDQIVALGFEESGDTDGWGFYHLSDEALALVPQLKTIRFLDLFEACDMGRATDAGLAHLATATSLTTLRLGPGVTDLGLAAVAGFVNLRELRIDSADGVTD